MGKPRMNSWSLVTVTFNSRPDLERFWAGGVASGIEWIVVDNASTDGSAELAESLGATVVRLSKNVGFGAANNVGIELASAQYVACLNPDVRVVEDELSILQEAIDNLGGFVAPQLLNPDGSLQANGRGAPTLANKLLNRMLREGRHRTYRRIAASGEILRVTWAMGAAIAARRDTWQSVGGWDDRYFIYYEDAELGLAGAQLGFPTHVVGAVRWTHGWARETARLRIEPWRQEFRSAATFYRRHPGLLLPGKTRALQDNAKTATP